MHSTHWCLNYLSAQTGAGKTFTMGGDLHNYAHRGIIPRALHHVFREVDMRLDKMYKIQVCSAASAGRRFVRGEGVFVCGGAEGRAPRMA